MNKMKMKMKMKINIIITLVIIAIAASIFFLVPMKDSPLSGGPVGPSNLPNKVEVVSNVTLPAQEKESLLKSIDEYMNEHRLPKGVENSYKIVLEARLHDSIRLIINPEDKSSDSKTILYARKANDSWHIDLKGGPWCTLEEFDQGEC